jgi:predicted MFS family arabinose efflux permease
VVWELRTDHPALDVRVFSNRRFSAAVISVLLTYFALMGGMFLFTFYLQSARGLTPLQAGLWSLPFAASQLIFSPLSSTIVKRFGARTVASVGLTGIGAAFLCYQFADATSPLWGYGLAAFVQGAFTAIVMPSATTTVLTSLPPEQSGMGSSVTSTARQVGGAVGVAVLGSALATGYRHRMEPLVGAAPGVPASGVRQGSGSIQATQNLVEQIVKAHPQAAVLIAPAKDAFLHAMHLTALSTAAVLMAAGALSSIACRRDGPVRQAAGTAHAQATPIPEV